MPPRTKEEDALTQMTATLNHTISAQVEPVMFGETMSSANFLAEQAVKNARSKGNDSDYSKVSTMMSAVKDHITSQSTPEKVTRKFNEFVLLLYNNLKLDDLAQQLVDKLCEVKPGYKSPLDELCVGISAGVVQPYSTSMTVEELYSWLLSNHLPQEDCKLIKMKSINGLAFKYIDWRRFGVSSGGLIILREHIMKQALPPNPNHGQAVNGSTSNGTSDDGSSSGIQNGASSQGIGTTSSNPSNSDVFDPDASFSDSSTSACDSEVQEVLEHQLTIFRDQIMDHYARFVSRLCKCVKDKKTTVEDFRTYLLRLSAFAPGLNKQQGRLLADVKEKLEQADSINKIFDLIGEECASFLNDGIFQSIREEYCSDVDCQELKYSEHLKKHIDKHRINEFFSVNPQLEKVTDASKTIKLKLDIKLTNKVTKLIHLKRAIAIVLGVTPDTLRLISVKKGCVFVTLLIPASVADVVFADKNVVQRMLKYFNEALDSFLWMEYDDYRFYINGDTPHKVTSSASSGTDIIKLASDPTLDLETVSDPTPTPANTSQSAPALLSAMVSGISSSLPTLCTTTSPRTSSHEPKKQSQHKKLKVFKILGPRIPASATSQQGDHFVTGVSPPMVTSRLELVDKNVLGDKEQGTDIPATKLQPWPATGSAYSLTTLSLDPDIEISLKKVLKANLHSIVSQYGLYVSGILQSLKDRRVGHQNLVHALLKIPAFSPKQELTLLSTHTAELQKAGSIDDIFKLLEQEYASFFNYNVFQFIVDDFQLDHGQEQLKYPQHLRTYLEKHKVSEFIQINPLLEEKKPSENTKKLVLKFDIEETCKLAKIENLQAAIAKILNILPSTLQLMDIKEGCIMVTFLIPTPVAEILFSSLNALSHQQVNQFRALSTLWLDCYDFRFDFTAEVPFVNTDHEEVDVLQQDERQTSQCMICLGVAEDPLLHEECGKLFCKECIEKHEEYGTCPHCKREMLLPYKRDKMCESVDEQDTVDNGIPMVLSWNIM